MKRPEAAGPGASSTTREKRGSPYGSPPNIATRTAPQPLPLLSRGGTMHYWRLRAMASRPFKISTARTIEEHPPLVKRKGPVGAMPTGPRGHGST